MRGSRAVSERPRSRDAARYKKAATDALTLLDWCIEYLTSNGHRRVAKQLAHGRNGVHALLQGGSRNRGWP
jgi:hypothetical protein